MKLNLSKLFQEKNKQTEINRKKKIMNAKIKDLRRKK